MNLQQNIIPPNEYGLRESDPAADVIQPDSQAEKAKMPRHSPEVPEFSGHFRFCPSQEQSPCRKDHHNKDQLKNDLTKSSGFSFMIVPLGEVIFTHPSAAMLRETFLPSLNGMTNSLDMAVSAIRIVRELLLQKIDLPILKALQNQRKRNRPLLTVNDIPCIFFHIMVQDQCAYPVHFLIARHSRYHPHLLIPHPPAESPDTNPAAGQPAAPSPDLQTDEHTAGSLEEDLPS